MNVFAVVTEEQLPGQEKRFPATDSGEIESIAHVTNYTWVSVQQSRRLTRRATGSYWRDLAYQAQDGLSSAGSSWTYACGPSNCWELHW
jgi:hypothetical protein